MFSNLYRPSKDIANTGHIRNLTRGINLETNKIMVFTDRACMNNGKADTKCGSGIWFGRDHRLNKAVKVPGLNQSNQVGKLVMVIAAVEATPNYHKLRIIMDFKYSVAVAHELAFFNFWNKIDKNLKMFVEVDLLISWGVLCQV